MTITVLIATYNRARLLAECLDHLARQAFEPGDEVVVVDNGSSDETAQIVKARVNQFPVPLRYALEPTPGKSHALRLGMSMASGEIFAFTDDDVIVDDTWVATIRALWREQGDLGLAGGRVLPRWSRPAPSWLRFPARGSYGCLSAPLAVLDYGSDRTPLGDRTAIGANMAAHRRALAAAGGFPVELGKLRGTLLMGEDHQICERVQAKGFAAVYDPRLVVRHYVPPERLRLGYHVRWFYWAGITNAAMDAARTNRTAAAARSPGVLRYWIARMLRSGVRAAGAATIGRTSKMAEAVVDVAFAAGYLAFVRGWTSYRPQGTPPTPQRLEAA